MGNTDHGDTIEPAWTGWLETVTFFLKAVNVPLHTLPLSFACRQEIADVSLFLVSIGISKANGND